MIISLSLSLSVPLSPALLSVGTLVLSLSLSLSLLSDRGDLVVDARLGVVGAVVVALAAAAAAGAHSGPAVPSLLLELDAQGGAECVFLLGLVEPAAGAVGAAANTCVSCEQSFLNSN